MCDVIAVHVVHKHIQIAVVKLRIPDIGEFRKRLVLAVFFKIRDRLFHHRNRFFRRAAIGSNRNRPKCAKKKAEYKPLD